MDNTTLVRQLRETGLWPEDPAVQQSLEVLVKEMPEGKQLARELIRRNLLTAYQANQFLTGKGQDLVVGPYLLLERLGEGASGLVFKARLRGAPDIVALKLIRPERLTNPVAVARFFREVEAAAMLQHPNVIILREVGQVGCTFYFAMQFIPGPNLARRVQRVGPLSIGEACDFIRQAALGLSHIHEHGVVHRDIKPSNLAITEILDAQEALDAEKLGMPLVPGQVKVLDLGMARLCEVAVEGQPRQQALTRLGVVMGTMDYMAPEQGRDSRSVDARTDLYSLGCTLYFALTGKPPFPGGTPLQKLMHHQLDEPERIENLRPDVPPALAGIVRKLMAKNAAARFQTAAEVAAVLAAFCAATPPTAVIARAGEAPPREVPVTTPGPAPLAILVPTPEATAVAAPEFNLGEMPEEQFVLSPSAIRPGRAPRHGEWHWLGIAAVLGVASLLLVAVLRLIFL